MGAFEQVSTPASAISAHGRVLSVLRHPTHGFCHVYTLCKDSFHMGQGSHPGNGFNMFMKDLL